MIDSVKTKNFKLTLIELSLEQQKRRGWKDASDSCRHRVEVTHNIWDGKLVFEIWSFYNDYTDMPNPSPTFNSEEMKKDCSGQRRSFLLEWPNSL